MSTPKISIIIPVYKVEKYLRKCLDSIIAQSFNDYEALLIDDGSPDGSGEICDEYAKKDSRFKVFHQKNAGVSTARNTALKNAKGEWLAFIDPDDWIKEDYLKHHYDAISDDVDMVVSGHMREIDGVIAEIYKNKEEKINVVDIFNEKDMFKNLTPWSKIYRRSVIENNNLSFLDKAIKGGDVLFNLLFFTKINKIQFIDAIDYIYLIRSDSLVSSHHSFDYGYNFWYKEARLQINTLLSNNKTPYIKDVLRRCIMDSIKSMYRKKYLLKRKDRLQNLKNIFETEKDIIDSATPNNILKKLKNHLSLLDCYMKLIMGLREGILSGVFNYYLRRKNAKKTKNAKKGIKTFII